MNTNKVIDMEKLGDWARFAVEHRLDPDIFELCLAVDFNTVIGTTEFEYAGEQVRIVHPNFFVNDRLFNIVDYFHSDEPEELIANFKQLTLDLLFRDIMSACGRNSINEIRRREFADHAPTFIHIYNAFSKRGFTVVASWDEKAQRPNITLMNYEDEVNVSNFKAIADFIVEKVNESYLFDNIQSAIHKLTNVANANEHFYYSDAVRGRSINSNNVRVGPLAIMAQPTNDHTEFLPAVVTLNGDVVEGGVVALYNPRSGEALGQIIADNYDQFLDYAYLYAIKILLFSNAGDIIEKEQIFDEIARRKHLQQFMTEASGVSIHIESDKDTHIFKLRRQYLRDKDNMNNVQAPTQKYAVDVDKVYHGPVILKVENVEETKGNFFQPVEVNCST